MTNTVATALQTIAAEPEAALGGTVAQTVEATSDWLTSFTALVDTVDGYVWGLADTFNGLMAFPNLVALVCLSPVVWRTTKDYLTRCAR